MKQLNIYEAMYDNFKFKKDKITLFEAFAGVGSQAMALKRLSKEIGFELDVIGIIEINPHSVKSYNAIHGETKNYGDISKLEELPHVDICTWSFPCQDVSIAGTKGGMQEGTQSNFGYVFLDKVKQTKLKPTILLMENVKNLISKTFIDDFENIKRILESMGYKNYWKVLNAKDYGIPQNRERIFMISILGDYNYNFPKPIPLELTLKDKLESNVDEKYYLSEKMLQYLLSEKTKNYNRKEVFMRNFKKDRIVASTIATTPGSRATDNYIPQPSNTTICLNTKVNGKQPSLQNRIYLEDGINTAITTGFRPYIAIKEKTKQGYKKAYDGDGIYIDRPHQKRGVVQSQSTQTIKKNNGDLGVVLKNVYKNGDSYYEFLRVRKLTPKECWRLMDFTDDDFEKAAKV
ncbi:MAG: DNA (cytosine-5-)-methyltransferase, partial [bacterium]